MSLLTTNTSQKITATLINIAILSGLMPYGVKSVAAQTTLACEDVNLDLLQLSNNAFVRYGNTNVPFRFRQASNTTSEQYGIVTNAANTIANPTNEANLPLRLVSLGIEDLEGNVVSGLGAIALDLNELYQAQGLTDLDSRKAVLELNDGDLLSVLGGFGNQALSSLGLPNNQVESL